MVGYTVVDETMIVKEKEGESGEWEIKTKNLLLASVRIFHAFIVAEKEFSIKQLHSYHSKDEMEKDVDDEDVEDILERVNNTVEHSLQFWNTLDRLQRPEFQLLENEQKKC